MRDPLLPPKKKPQKQPIKVNIETLDQLLDVIYRNSMLKHEKLNLILKSSLSQLNIETILIDKGVCTITLSERTE